jgi:hypothetical protein
VRMALLQSILIFIAYSLFGGLEKGIDNAAHIGGVASGFTFGYIFYAGFSIKKGNRVSMLIIIGITVSILATSFYIIGNKREEVTYMQLMQQLSIQEDKAFSIRIRANYKSKQTRLTDLKTIARPAWNECKRILRRADSLQLKEKEWLFRKEMMERYIEERIVENGLLISSIENNENKEAVNKVDSIRAVINDKVDSLRYWHPKKY